MANGPLDDLIELLDQDAGRPRAARPAPCWRVLVVDDDEDVHQTTRFVLGKAEIFGRPIELIHAHSAAEALQCLHEREDIAVALVDVVMETPDAGLRLVREIRGDGFSDLRIVLRTGQPGYAPELSVISEYEIDDYRTKAELTRVRLLTVLTAAIRTYSQICMIRHNRNGLEMIVESATELFRRTNLELFSRGVLVQIASLLGVDPHGIVCVGGEGDRAFGAGRIITSTGRFSRFLGMSLSELGDPVALEALEASRRTEAPVFKGNFMALSFRSEGGRELSALIEAASDIAPDDLALLKLYSTNIAVGFDNLSLLENLDRLAYVDSTLEMPNLNAFEAALDEWRGSERAGVRLALVSLDSHTTMTATYGVHVANGVLEQAYRLLKDGAGGNGNDITVARIADSCFALLGPPDALDARRIEAAFPQSYTIGDVTITATATSTLIDLQDRNEAPFSIIRAANAALLHVMQTQRGNCVVFNTTMRATVERQIGLQVGLKRILESGEGLAVHLQPKFALDTHEIAGAEALLRWTWRGESVPPAEFIPIAETAGLTAALTAHVVRTIGRWMRERQGKAPVSIAVNLSMTDLNHPGFARRLMQWVASAGISPERLEFEVTEGIAMKESPWAIHQVQELKQAGFGIALDDFGTGYSSLGYISQLPIDTLKIDKSFIAPLDAGNAHKSLAGIILAMTHALDLKCVAEGIETEEQGQVLRKLGCTIGQGYLFGKPVPIGEFDAKFG